MQDLDIIQFKNIQSGFLKKTWPYEGPLNLTSF